MQNNLIFELGKILKLEENYLNELSDDYQKADEEDQYKIMKILWDNFSKLYKKLINLKYQQSLAEIALDKKKLTSNLYQQARNEVLAYFEKILTGEIEDDKKINEIRQRILAFS